MEIFDNTISFNSLSGIYLSYCTDSNVYSNRLYDNGDGIVNLLATIREAAAAIVFKESEDGQVDISIRSRPGVDISPIAIHFGGGGHPQAAGSILQGSLDQVIPKVLSKAKQVLNSNR